MRNQAPRDGWPRDSGNVVARHGAVAGGGAVASDSTIIARPISATASSGTGSSASDSSPSAEHASAAPHSRHLLIATPVA